MAALTSAGTYLPSCTIEAEAYVAVWGRFAGPGIEAKRVPAYDEDTFTMGLEAAGAALGSRRERPALVAFATSGPERGAASLGEALELPAARAADYNGSPHAGVAALLGAYDFVAARGQPALVVAADLPRSAPDDPAEHPQGAGAAACLISPLAKGGATLLASASRGGEVYGEGDPDSQGYPRYQDPTSASLKAARQAVQALLEEVDSASFTLAVTAEPDLKVRSAPLQGLVDPALQPTPLADRTGDTGAASLLLSLVQALSRASAGDKLLAVGWGGGSGTALALEMKGAVACPQPPQSLLEKPSQTLTYARYALQRGYLATPATYAETPMGAALPLPGYLATLAARYRLVGQECSACGWLLFPPRELCPACRSSRLIAHAFKPEGTVYSYTHIGRGGAPSEFARQQDLTGPYGVAVVELAGSAKAVGPRLAAMVTGPNLTGGEAPPLAIGQSVRLVVRRLYRQQGIWRYGYKARPLEDKALPPEEA